MRQSHLFLILAVVVCVSGFWACSGGSGGGVVETTADESASSITITGTVPSVEASAMTTKVANSTASTSCLADTVAAVDADSDAEVAEGSVDTSCAFSVSVSVDGTYSMEFSLDGALVASLAADYNATELQSVVYMGSSQPSFNLGTLSVGEAPDGSMAFRPENEPGNSFDRDGDGTKDREDTDLDGDGILNSEEQGRCVFNPDLSCTDAPAGGGDSGSGGESGGGDTGEGGSGGADSGDGSSDGGSGGSSGGTSTGQYPACTSGGIDMDGDAYPKPGSPEGTAPGGEYDCDDGEAGVNPGALEMPCNQVDENCDGDLAQTSGSILLSVDGCTTTCAEYNAKCSYSYDESYPIMNGSEQVGCYSGGTIEYDNPEPHANESEYPTVNCPGRAPSYTTCSDVRLSAAYGAE